MMRIAVLDDYQDCAETLANWSNVRAKAELKIHRRPIGDENELARVLRDCDALCLIRERTPISSALLSRLPALRLIVLAGPRTAKIDTNAAESRGIEVRVTGGGPIVHATAELTIGLVFALARGIPQSDRGMRVGKWLEASSLGRVMHGSTLGIIGLGRVGAYVAELGHAMGMHVLAWSRNPTRERAEAHRVELAPSKTDLLKRADFVTLHLALAPQTVGTISAPDLAYMKPTAFLVNTARAALIVEDDLFAALAERRIAGAAIDVFDDEPLPPTSRWRTLENVIVTPHCGYATKEIYGAFFREMVAHLEDWLGRHD